MGAIMEISGVTSASSGGSIAIKVQKENEEIQKQNAQTLIEALPDPDSSLGQNINVKA